MKWGMAIVRGVISRKAGEGLSDEMILEERPKCNEGLSPGYMGQAFQAEDRGETMELGKVK